MNSIGCFLLLATAVAPFGSCSALLGRLQHGRGMLFMDVEVLGLLALICSIAGGAIMFMVRKIKKRTSSC